MASSSQPTSQANPKRYALFSFNKHIKPDANTLVVSVIILLIGCNYSYYTINLAFDIPWGDHWRWIKGLLIPLANGEITFWHYLTGEFYPLSHSHILTLAEMWISYKFLNLDYRLGYYIGLFSTLAVIVLLCTSFFNSLKEYRQRKLLALGTILISIILLNPLNVIAWSLVQFEYLYLFIAILLLYIFNKIINQNLNYWVGVTMIIASFFIGDAIGITAILSILTYIIIYEFKRHYLKVVGIVSLIGIGLFMANIAIPNMHSNLNISKQQAIIYILSNPLITAKFVLNAFAQSVVPYQAVKHVIGNGWEYVHRTIGFLAILLTFFSFYLHSKYRKIYIKTDLPILLIIYTFISILGISLTRLPQFDENCVLGGRYLRLFQLGMIGNIWISYAVALNAKSYKIAINYRKSVLIVSSIIILSFVVQSIYAWKYLGSHKKYLNNVADAIIAYSVDPDFDIGSVHVRCKNDFCKDSIKFLKANKLSLFRSNE